MRCYLNWCGDNMDYKKELEQEIELHKAWDKVSELIENEYNQYTEIEYNGKDGYDVIIKGKPVNNYHNLQCWCFDNLSDEWTCDLVDDLLNYKFTFKNSKDALQFKLVWC